jgi:hypothetical protein
MSSGVAIKIKGSLPFHKTPYTGITPKRQVSPAVGIEEEKEKEIAVFFLQIPIIPISVCRPVDDWVWL